MGEDERPQDWKIRQYYQQEEVVDHIVSVAEYREIAPTYPQGYGRRPDAINFPGDFSQLVENGAVAFHASVERWKNPLLIDNVNNLDDLRTGWDLVIDIDCDHSFELAKDTAELVVKELREHGIENISVKFSGNRGFHIGVRSEAFPDRLEGEDVPEVFRGENLAALYPKLPRGIIQYLRDSLESRMKDLVKQYGFEEEMKVDTGWNPYRVCDIENDWGQRHLFRLPYSLHDGSWLVSLPIESSRIQDFEKSDAEMDEIDFEATFLEDYEEGEATNLVLQAVRKIAEEERKKKAARKKRANRDFDRPDDAIPEEYWPPTIHNILEGLEDGRKRGLFILINFLRTVGYSWPEVESKIWDWNEENAEPLREAYVKSQLNWHKKRDEDVPPPNYDAKGYYKDMQVYEGDNLEEKVPNPVSYAFRKAKGDENLDIGSSEEDSDGDEVLECPYCGKEYKMEHYYKKHVQKCFG